MIAPMYHVIFYDIDLPRTVSYAMQKRINEKKWLNITDGIMDKTVELKTSDGQVALYKTEGEIMTFNVFNSVDNAFYAVCNVKKLNENFLTIIKPETK